MTDGRSGAEGDLRRKLTWLTVFRAVATSLLLVVLAVGLLAGPAQREPTRGVWISFGLIAGVYLLTLVYGLVLRRGTVGPQVAYVQVLGDLLLAATVVYLTGGLESPFVFTYALAVLVAAILLFRRGALIAATVSTLAHGGVALGVHLAVIPAPTGYANVTDARLAFALATHALSQYFIAVLAGFLAEQLVRAGGRLSAREEDIKQLVALQNRIVNAMPSGLITCEASGEITFINPAAQAILGLRDPAPGQLTMEVLFPGFGRLKLPVRRAELRVATRLGERTLGLTVTALEERTGASLVVFQDLTDLHRLQDELQRIDHLASLGRVSAQLAHEIRNPLASMRGSAQLLAEDLAHDPQARKLAAVVMRESDRLAELVESYLRLARPPPPSVAPVRLDRIASETLEMIRTDPIAAGVTLEERLQPVTGLADGGQLRQVLINLLRNALAVVGHHGTVRVTVDAPQSGSARIEVWDSAGAIGPDDLGRIFEPFFSTREGGTGLGLSTVHAIVRAHGGGIEVTSSPAQGTFFTVELPMAGAPAPAQEPPEGASAPAPAPEERTAAAG